MTFYDKYINIMKEKIDKQAKSIISNKQDSDLTKERFLVLTRQGIDEVDECTRPCTNDDDCLRECYHKLETYHNTIQIIKSSSKSWKPYYLPCVSESLDKDTTEYLDKLNTEISKRTTYGVREELVESDSIMIHWSNSSQDWTPIPRLIKKGEQIKLDANQVLIQFDKKLGHDKIGHAVSCANPLPLYSFSWEAKKRGQVPFLEATLLWAKAQIEANKKKELQERHS